MDSRIPKPAARLSSLFAFCFGYVAICTPLPDENSSEEDTPNFIRFYGERPIRVTADGKVELSPYYHITRPGLDLIVEDAVLMDAKLEEVAVAAADLGFHPEVFTGAYDSQAAEPFRLPQTGEVNPNRGGGAHGAGAVNLINGVPPVGAAVRAKINALISVRSSEDLPHALKNLRDSRPQLVNFSEVPDVDYEDGEADGKQYENSLKGLEEIGKETILVGSAGNLYPAPAWFARENIRSFVAQGATYNGLLNWDSQAGGKRGVWVVADRWVHTITAQNGKSNLGQVTRSSAAAAILTGALANVLSVFSFDFEKLLDILDKTAIRINTLKEVGKRWGTLNAYKLFRVAVRQQKENRIDFSFEVESEKLVKEGKNLMRSSNGVERKRGFDKIRRAFLLNPAHEEARRIHIATYTFENLRGDVEFYQSLKFDDLMALLKEKLESSGTDEFQARSAARTAAVLPEESAVIILNLALAHESMGVRTSAVYALRDMGKRGVTLLANWLRKGPEVSGEELRLAICRTVCAFRHQGLPLEELGLEGLQFVKSQARRSPLPLERVRNIIAWADEAEVKLKRP